MIKTVKTGTLEYLTASNIAVPHMFTTRLGGVSGGYLSSMNIGTHRRDSSQNVEENFLILCRQLSIPTGQLVLTRQTHTDTVRAVDKSDWGAGLYKAEFDPCDALITNTPGTGLVVFTADCTPVLLHDPVTGAVGAVHAGWRGTAMKLAAKTALAMAERFGCKPENIHAAIGPNIGQCCFQTDADVPQAMVESYGDAARAHILSKGPKYYVNLKALNALALEEVGVTSIAISDACTACQPDRFWSHRIVGTRRGSQGAIIVCKEGNS